MIAKIISEAPENAKPPGAIKRLLGFIFINCLGIVQGVTFHIWADGQLYIYGKPKNITKFCSKNEILWEKF